MDSDNPRHTTDDGVHVTVLGCGQRSTARYPEVVFYGTEDYCPADLFRVAHYGFML